MKKYDPVKQKIYDEARKESRKEYKKQHINKNREKLLLYSRSEHYKNLQFKIAKYKIGERDFTVEDYSRIFLEQNGKCACCGKTESRKDIKTNGDYRYEKLAVDHDHLTGQVRGLLCFACNRGIGMLGDNIESLEKAINYLKIATG